MKSISIQKYFFLLLEVIVALAILILGYVFLKSWEGSKLFMVIVAIIWGVGSVAILFYVLNSIAETLPRKTRSIVLPVVFAGPALLLLLWFLILPTIRTFSLSFFNDTGRQFIGLTNYGNVFTDGVFWESFRNNIYWLVFGTSGSVGIGLLIAVLADKSRFENIYKALIFLPMAISFVGAGVIWKFIYAYKGEGANIVEIGLLNAIITGLGFKAQAWLQLPFWNNLLLIIIMVWLQTGYAMVILSSAIKGIPSSLIEAAKVDGATEFQVFRHIMIPEIMGTLITVSTTIVIFSLKLFDIVRVMTGGNFGTNVIANEFYLRQFTQGRTGEASALAILLLVAVVPVLLYNLRQFQGRKAFK
ncbi:carbohydrate ABC transporter permease [Spirochaeta cellobiosiphila]|uniref:carbohydrate ABC transporter permease n=1 Tax=Spirochaeta cellobiosiphila TaxID=504483 RepID=UPI000406AD2D|nr:sugar ABC transporter permease [Spirochaeta cellobiosiphila]